MNVSIDLQSEVTSFTFKCLVADDDIYIVEASQQMYGFFGTNKDSYKDGMFKRVARDINSEVAANLSKMCKDEKFEGKDFRITYKTKRSDGTICDLQIDAYAGEITEKGQIYNFIGMDVSALENEKKKNENLANQYEKMYTASCEFLDSIADTYLATMRVNVSQNKVEMINGTNPHVKQNEFLEYDMVVQEIMSTMPRSIDRERFIEKFSRGAIVDAYNNGKNSISMEYCFKPSADAPSIWVKTKMNLLKRPKNNEIIAFDYVLDINRNKIVEMLMDKVIYNQYDFISTIDAENDAFELMSSGSDNYIENDFFSNKKTSGYNDIANRFVNKYVIDEEKDEVHENMRIENIIKELKNNGVYSVSLRINEDGMIRNKKFDFYFIEPDINFIALTCIDFTALQQKQNIQAEKLRDALKSAQQANVAKTEFLSRMSHEIRTPMNAIIGMDTLAARAIGNDDKVSDCIAKIGISARYLLSLINDILDMSRIESGKMMLKNESFIFREFITSINTMIYNQATGKGLDYECIVSSEIEENYIGDGMKLQQVLVNILGNAVKFTQKGKISLEVMMIEKKDKTQKLRFIVSDTGCGISDEDIQQIFDPFSQVDTSTTTPFGGTGLGLAITRNLVNMMGGSVYVRSIVDIGSEFIVDVPLAIDTSLLVKKDVNYNFDKLNALVVDDDVVICEQANIILKEMGMIGEWVFSGHDAVKLVEEKASADFYYDFILIDWKMPDMDGIETTRNIRKIVGPDVTIIIISAYDWEMIETEAKLAGANLLISKPLFKSTLVSAFQKSRGEIQNISTKELDFDFSGKRALLAEDNIINAEIAKALLEDTSFEVEIVSNGLEAMEKFAESPVGYYDVILMDVRMPIMDGLQATNNIRRWRKDDAKSIPIIAMTANAFDEDIEKTRAAGMNAHLSKPIEPELLYRTLYRFIMES